MTADVRHFSALAPEDEARLFAHRPEEFDRDSDRSVLAVALGATLYLPATRARLAHDLLRRGAAGVRSAVVCLEDAVADGDLEMAEANAVAQLRELSRRHREDPAAEAPLVFVRVREPAQIGALVAGLGDAVDVLSGFVLPKFTELSGPPFLDAVRAAAAATGRRLLAMPVIESPEMLHRESRHESLFGVQRVLQDHRDAILAVRIGATDLSGGYAIRRDRDLTIYDVRLVADLIADVVNVLGRADGTGHVITGPVWEHFSGHERLFKPRLRTTPFHDNHADDLRADLITRDLDGLIREVVLDKVNGLLGKTVIHPTHVPVVHALSVVTHEEFEDASDVLRSEPGGVAASSYRNKMNEAKPHRRWAERTVLRARAFGVAAEDVGVVDILAASAGS